MDPLLPISYAELLVAITTTSLCVSVIGFTFYLVGWQLRFLMCSIDELDYFPKVFADFLVGAVVLCFIYAYVKLYLRFRHAQSVILHTKGLWQRFDSLMHSSDGIY